MGTCCVDGAGDSCMYGGCSSIKRCDGSCPPQCQYDSDCGYDSYCDNGCCAFYGGGGGGDPCAECPESCGPDGCGNLDPIVIDLSARKYQMTSLQNGVMFDFYGRGHVIKMSWTAVGSATGFLALDRNGNGKIDDGRELFGTATPQRSVRGVRNGFLALKEYDQTSNGGNGDGWINANDAIFPKLLVWVDRNHNAVSEPGELMSLPQAGIAAISLDYQKSSWTDVYGNQFRFRSNITTTGPNWNNTIEHWIYDVALVR